jgi:hypothetical protein
MAANKLSLADLIVLWESYERSAERARDTLSVGWFPLSSSFRSSGLSSPSDVFSP